MDRNVTGNDRELFSELVEPLIKPVHLHMNIPLPDSPNSPFVLDINGEALWQLRSYSNDTLFEVLNKSLMQLGFQLKQSSCIRIGKGLRCHVHNFRTKIMQTRNGNRRKSLKRTTWKAIKINLDEILKGPLEVINRLRQRIEQLEKDNEENVKELYDAMVAIKKIKGDSAHRGKEYSDVSKNQQRRHVNQIRYGNARSL